MLFFNIFTNYADRQGILYSRKTTLYLHEALYFCHTVAINSRFLQRARYTVPYCAAYLRRFFLEFFIQRYIRLNGKINGSGNKYVAQ